MLVGHAIDPSEYRLTSKPLADVALWELSVEKAGGDPPVRCGATVRYRIRLPVTVRLPLMPVADDGIPPCPQREGDGVWVMMGPANGMPYRVSTSRVGSTGTNLEPLVPLTK